MNKHEWKWNDESRNKNISIDQTNHINFRRPELIAADPQPVQDDPVSVKIMIDGPVVIKGNFAFQYSGNKKEIKEGIISLCRCGASNHLPFCDGTHRKVGFEDK